MKCTKCGLIKRTVADIVGCAECADGTAAQVKHLPYETQIEHAAASVIGLANRFVHHAEEVIERDVKDVENFVDPQEPTSQEDLDAAYQRGVEDGRNQAPQPEDPTERQAALDAARSEGHATGWAEAKEDSANAQAAIDAAKPQPSASADVAAEEQAATPSADEVQQLTQQ